jgi:hypothetical protein
MGSHQTAQDEDGGRRINGGEQRRDVNFVARWPLDGGSSHAEYSFGE